MGKRRYEITGQWIKLHNAELHALISSPNIIRNLTSRRLRWAGHVAPMGNQEMPTEFQWENLRERDHKEAET